MPSGFATLDTGFPNIKKIDDLTELKSKDILTV